MRARYALGDSPTRGRKSALKCWSVLHPTEVLYPDPDWQLGNPEEHDLDPVLLDEAAAAAENFDSHCLLVIRNGVLVFERYFHGSDAQATSKSWSMAKSYAGALVGIAIERGDIGSLADSVADYVPEWAATENASITVGDLISMTSGLEWSVFTDYAQMTTLAGDQTAFALDLDLDAAPGSEWTYHNGGVQILEPLIRNATGVGLEDYASEHLWSKIGMSGEWARDREGNPTAYANVHATFRDHARFGYLYLREGAWTGGQVLRPSWVADSLSPSQDINRAYGNLFWRNGFVPAKSAMMEDKDGILVPFAPNELFAARGFGNQFIDVIPSLELVVVRLGADVMTSLDLGALIDDARFDIHAEILAPILGAVR